MYECLAKKPDLIILDDPISSFDKNKKSAILEMLFRRETESCLKKTVLMLTHDIEPLIDTLKSVQKQFNNQVNAFFLRLTKGTIEEHTIKSHDLIIKLIYLRRYYEILDNKGNAYQVLSNLFKKRKKLIDQRNSQGKYRRDAEMNSKKIDDGVKEIQRSIDDLRYDSTLESVSSIDKLIALYHECENGYEKLQIFRLIKKDTGNSVVRKFINGTYLIEMNLLVN